MSNQEEQEPGEENKLASLAAFATQSGYDRLILRPGRVTGDGAMGMEVVDFPWDSSCHADATAAFGRTAEYGEWLASWVGDALVLKRVTAVNNTLEAWIGAQLISPLAARMVSASLSSGRNVLVAGADGAAAGFAVALGDQSLRPALVGGHQVPTPDHWVRAHTLQDVGQIGADRLVVVGGREALVVDALLNHSGVIANIDARRLDRALMRMELAFGEKLGAEQAPLAMLASIDLVVVLGAEGSGRVEQIVELQFENSGYRPAVLMCRAIDPIREALVPIAQPSYLNELRELGLEELVEDYLHGLPVVESTDSEDSSQYETLEDETVLDDGSTYQIRLPEAPPTASALAKVLTKIAPTVSPHLLGNPANLRTGVVLPPPGMGQEPAPKLSSDAAQPRALVESEDEPPPGWELDQLPESSFATDVGQASYDDGVMAATYGLAPPPAPRAVDASSVHADLEELLEAARRRGTFEED